MFRGLDKLKLYGNGVMKYVEEMNKKKLANDGKFINQRVKFLIFFL